MPTSSGTNATTPGACRSQWSIDDAFDWGDDRLLDQPQAESVIYEVHVKGFSKLCPHIPEELRGTYAALGSDFAIDYFKKLGVTAVELLPVHHFVNDQFLEDKGLTNYWGYNSIGYFAPHSAYCAERHDGRAGAWSSRRWSSGCTPRASR